jgi:hypothetical protein
MKNSILQALFLFALPHLTSAQLSPDWTRSINALPDSASVYPVRTLHDGNGNVYVLSTWDKQTSPGRTKIHLRKYTPGGTLEWTYIYGDSTPRGMDLAVDDAGNSYIAGEHKEVPHQKPLLLKVSPGGILLWVRDSTSSFGAGRYEQLILKHNLLYLRGPGLAIFNTNGTEKWSNHLFAERICIDNHGRMIASAWDTASNTLFRYDSTGVRDLADSSIMARRIATDNSNNIYLLTDMPNYALVKHDSSGNIEWFKTDFPFHGSFGDIGFEVLTDNDNNVLLAGIADTLYKFTPQGTQIWRKPMDGLDNYLISAQVVFDNMLALAGTHLDGNDYMMKVVLYNLQGNPNWIGIYNGNVNMQEFTMSMTATSSGIYAVENDRQNGILVKFPTTFFEPVNFSLICIDSIWYDTSNPYIIHTRVFNGSINHLNYPTVQIISPTGDTVGNPQNQFNFFAHMGNSYLVYSDSITTTGITNWSSYTFVMSDGLADTSSIVRMCSPTGILSQQGRTHNIRIWPNPFSDHVNIGSTDVEGGKVVFRLYDMTGRVHITEDIAFPQLVDCKGLARGVYFYTLDNAQGRLASGKIVAE